MINAGIFDGDQVLVKQQSSAENGDMVVALVEDAATVKTFIKKTAPLPQPGDDDGSTSRSWKSSDPWQSIWRISFYN